MFNLFKPKTVKVAEETQQALKKQEESLTPEEQDKRMKEIFEDFVSKRKREILSLVSIGGSSRKTKNGKKKVTVGKLAEVLAYREWEVQALKAEVIQLNNKLLIASKGKEGYKPEELAKDLNQGE